MGEKYPGDIDFILEQFPELSQEDSPESSQDGKDVLKGGVPALKLVLKGLYTELRQNNPHWFWDNELRRDPLYVERSREAKQLVEVIFKETDSLLVLQVGPLDEGSEPIRYTKRVKEPYDVWYEVASLPPGTGFLITESHGEQFGNRNGWMHLTTIGQVIHQGGDLVLVKKMDWKDQPLD